MERPEVAQFKLLSALSYRVDKAAKMKRLHEGCLPVVILKDDRAKMNFKPVVYALNGKSTLGYLIYQLRAKFELPPTEGLMLYVEEFVPSLCKV
mmetsp:Transcript_23507/g.41660  ORF Transcript_23507/g.41660 Transcript_23507/m.41660 type:complete len:94 (-) Transcript_23507:700-981(-)